MRVVPGRNGATRRSRNKKYAVGRKSCRDAGARLANLLIGVYFPKRRRLLHQRRDPLHMLPPLWAQHCTRLEQIALLQRIAGQVSARRRSIR